MDVRLTADRGAEGSARCGYCGGALGRDEASVACPACAVAVHAACAAELDACPTTGCAAALPGTRGPAAAPEVVFAPRAFARYGALGAGFGLLILGFMVGGLFTTRRDLDFSFAGGLRWGMILGVGGAFAGALYGWLLGRCGVRREPAPGAKAANMMAILGGGLLGGLAGALLVGPVWGGTLGMVAGALLCEVPVVRVWGFDLPKGRT